MIRQRWVGASVLWTPASWGGSQGSGPLSRRGALHSAVLIDAPFTQI